MTVRWTVRADGDQGACSLRESSPIRVAIIKTVIGSNGASTIQSADLAHLVERHLAKVEVAGSSPVIRSIFGAIAKR